MPLTVVHEDRWLVVIDKPAGLVVHPAPGHEAGTLVNALLAHVRDLRGIGGELRPGIVHRIDKDTSGLLVVAKDDETMATLAAAFKAHTVERVYDALVAGKPPGPGGRIDTLYGRDPNARKKFSSRVRTGKAPFTNCARPRRSPVAGWSSSSRPSTTTASVAASMRWTVSTKRCAPRSRRRITGGGRRCVVPFFLSRELAARRRAALRGAGTRDALARPDAAAAARRGRARLAEALGRQALHARTLAFVHPDGAQMRVSAAARHQAPLEALRALG